MPTIFLSLSAYHLEKLPRSPLQNARQLSLSDDIISWDHLFSIIMMSFISEIIIGLLVTFYLAELQVKEVGFLSASMMRIDY